MASNAPWKDARWLPGVLNKEQMIALRDAKIITNIQEKNIGWDASAIDLHLSDEAYEMIKGSIKPFKKDYNEIISDHTYAKKISEDSSGTFLLKKGHCYVFRILEKLHPYINDTPLYGQATAKSTIGRLDVIARLIVNGMNAYESFNPQQVDTGDMFVEITPITFNVRVKAGLSISQLRFFYGQIKDSIIRDEQFIKSILHIPDGERNFGTLSVDLSNTEIDKIGTVAAAYCAKSSQNAINLWIKKKENQKYVQRDFWNPVRSKERDNLHSIVINTNKFYILRSLERISLPESVCVYCRAMDETLGEMRIHYAGFVHPCFGEGRKDGKLGTPLIFEVRGHNVKIFLTHKEVLARLHFYRMSRDVERPEEPKTGNKPKRVSYNEQGLNLSNLFQKNWK